MTITELKCAVNYFLSAVETAERLELESKKAFSEGYNALGENYATLAQKAEENAHEIKLDLKRIINSL